MQLRGPALHSTKAALHSTKAGATPVLVAAQADQGPMLLTLRLCLQDARGVCCGAPSGCRQRARLPQAERPDGAQPAVPAAGKMCKLLCSAVLQPVVTHRLHRQCWLLRAQWQPRSCAFKEADGACSLCPQRSLRRHSRTRMRSCAWAACPASAASPPATSSRCAGQHAAPAECRRRSRAALPPLLMPGTASMPAEPTVAARSSRPPWQILANYVLPVALL